MESVVCKNEACSRTQYDSLPVPPKESPTVFSNRRLDTSKNKDKERDERGE